MYQFYRLRRFMGIPSSLEARGERVLRLRMVQTNIAPVLVAITQMLRHVVEQSSGNFQANTGPRVGDWLCNRLTSNNAVGILRFDANAIFTPERPTPDPCSTPTCLVLIPVNLRLYAEVLPQLAERPSSVRRRQWIMCDD